MKQGELPAVVTVKGVRGYVNANNVAMLNVEDVARGLGFTQIAKSGNTVVRWERVNGYLREFGFIPTSGDGVKAGGYIPENMFYRLAMKANNAVAQKFQATVADEILPSIRKNGVYATDDFLNKTLADPDWAIGILTELKATREKNAALENQVAELKPKADYCERILQSKEALTVTVIAKDYGMGGAQFNDLLAKLKVQYKVGKTWVLYQNYANAGYTVTETKLLPNGLTVTITRWSQKGRMFLYQKLKGIGIVPVVERTEPMATLPGLKDFTYDGGYAPRVM